MRGQAGKGPVSSAKRGRGDVLEKESSWRGQDEKADVSAAYFEGGKHPETSNQGEGAPSPSATISGVGFIFRYLSH